ncbi:antitoxin [Sphingomonas sp. MMS12-HWE2-04]|uniref:antitoxin n=1 Tax=Sphingomonas sp. MMS12-HWE2-04 TaxID=3234199 RepID=UPI00384C1F62
MTNTYRAKTFKSGNSVALRLPKALGLNDGDDVRIVTHGDGTFSVFKEDEALALLMSLYGSMSSGFGLARGDIEQDARDWSSKPGSAEAA